MQVLFMLVFFTLMLSAALWLISVILSAIPAWCLWTAGVFVGLVCFVAFIERMEA